MNIIVFLLIAYGIANIMIFSSIFGRWRKLCNYISPKFLGELFTCMICLPFWIGIFLSIVLGSVSGQYFDNLNEIGQVFFDGCFTSAGVWLIHNIQEKLER